MERTIAASSRERVIGPTVSCLAEMGITRQNQSFQYTYVMKITAPPARDVRPTVGFIPTTLFMLAGDMMLPSVSVPSVTAARPIDAAMAEPDEEPPGSPFG